MELNEEQIKVLNEHGRSIKLDVDKYFNQFNAALTYQRIFANRAKFARKIGLRLAEFACEVEKMGYVKIYLSPSYKKYVFSTQCDWSQDMILEHLLILEEARINV